MISSRQESRFALGRADSESAKRGQPSLYHREIARNSCFLAAPVFAAPLILTLLLAPPMTLAEECETIIMTPPDNSKLRCEVCGGITMRCFPI